MRRGQKTSEETKRKIRESLKKVKVASRFKKGNKIGPRFQKQGVSFNKDKKLSENRRFEDKHPYWEGGKSPLATRIGRWGECLRWKEAVFSRDNFTCQKCGNKNGIQIHHIFTLAEIIKKFKLKNRADAVKCSILWDLNNGITLCKKCHWKEHGYKNWKDWNE